MTGVSKWVSLAPHVSLHVSTAPADMLLPQCIRALDGTDWNGRRLLVEVAKNIRWVLTGACVARTRAGCGDAPWLRSGDGRDNAGDTCVMHAPCCLRKRVSSQTEDCPHL